MAIVPRAVDPSQYTTVRAPERFEPDWRSFYAESVQWSLALKDKVPAKTGVMYGDDPFQTLDVFAPADAHDAPVFVFFHGGGFKEGHPSHYGYLADAFVERGAVFVTAGYRFEPEHGYPDYVHDGAQALKWVFENVEQFGGSPGRIFVGGHSAGANISALLSMRKEFLAAAGLPVDVINGCALFSGGYDFAITDPLYPDQDARPAGASIKTDLQHAPDHVLVVFGSPEKQRIGQSPDFFKRQGEALVNELAAIGVTPEVIVLPDTDHLRTGTAIGDKSSPAHAAVLRMLFA